MLKNIRYLIPVLFAGLCFAVITQAAAPVVEYSADIYQKTPQGVEVKGRVYVGKRGMRTDMERNGEEVIQVIDMKNQMSRILFPARQGYMELPRGAAIAATSNHGGEVNPCQGLPAARCRKLGKGVMNGRPIVKWMISFQQQGKQIEGTQWIDLERGMVVHQEMPDGQRMELKLLGTEVLNGRKVEKWEVQINQGGNLQRSLRWYDPALNLVVREVLPGGYLREMRNIQVGPQDPGLFRIPRGFRKIDPLQSGGGQRR